MLTMMPVGMLQAFAQPSHHRHSHGIPDGLVAELVRGMLTPPVRYVRPPVRESLETLILHGGEIPDSGFSHTPAVVFDDADGVTVRSRQRVRSGVIRIAHSQMMPAIDPADTSDDVS